MDAAGHRTSVMELSGRKVNYGYDTIYRLTNETIASDPNAMNGAVSYSYDAVGNRLQKTSTLPGFPGAASTYNSNDELATDTYDADGNTIGSGLNTGTSGYVYDFENRLVQQAGISIVYDGDGNRVSKTTANGTTKYLVDTLNPTSYAQVMDELQSSSVVRTYTWGLELIAQTRPQPTPNPALVSYFVFDGHGSVRALTNPSGAVTDTYDYDAFGILTHSTGTTPNNYLFAGEQFDPDLILYYNRARYLNTSTGRFWTMDSEDGDSTEPLSLHRYVYTSNDPVNLIDPSGHDGTLAETLVELPVVYVIASIAILSLTTACAAGVIIQHGPGFCGGKYQPLTVFRGLSSKGRGQWKPDYFSGDGLSLYETLYEGNYRFKLPFQIDYLEPKTSGTPAEHIYLPPFLGEIASIVYTPEHENATIGRGHWSLRLNPGIALAADLIEAFYDFAQEFAQNF